MCLSPPVLVAIYVPLCFGVVSLDCVFFSGGLVRATTGAPLVAAIFTEQEVEPETEANVGRV